MHSTDYGRSGNVFHDGQSARVRQQERAGTYWADQVIAVSHTTKNELTWMYEVPESKVTVVYNGVSMHRFEGEIDQGAVKQRYGIGPLDPTVLFCGRLVQQKGPDLMIEAIPSVLQLLPQRQVRLRRRRPACAAACSSAPGNWGSTMRCVSWATATGRS